MRIRASYAGIAVLTALVCTSGKSQAATFTVNNVTALRDAITTANTNGEDDTIIVSSSLVYNTAPYTDSGPNALPPIAPDGNHSLTIKANVANISLKFQNTTTKGRLLFVQQGGSLILENLSFSGGDANGDGGVVCIDRGGLTVRNCRFSQNRASGRGGAIYGDYGRMEVTNCQFDTNRAEGASLSAGGGAIGATAAVLTFTDCTFENNFAAGPGGGVRHYTLVSNTVGGYGPTTITRCTFRNNDGADGGGFQCENGWGTVTDSVFENNTGYWGGGINYTYIDSSSSPDVGRRSLDITRCTFRENGDINNTQLGGGIFTWTGNVNVKDSLFEGNKAYSDGAGIHLVQFSGFRIPHLTAENCTFDKNEGPYFGGGIGSEGNSAMQVFNCTFFQNNAGGGGGILSSGTGAITNCTFANNTAYAAGTSIANRGTATVKNNIFAGGTQTHIVNYSGTTTSLGNNLSTGTLGIPNHVTDILNTNPLLDPLGLQDNGGLTQTIALLTGSPAINRISGTPGTDYPATDQRGVARPSRTTADIGAFEALINTAPDTTDDSATTTVNQAVNIAVKTNDSDADGDTLSISGVTQPANGTATINGDGTITYTPSAGFTGMTSFTYTVNDGQPGGTDTATVQVIVQALTGPAKVLLGDAILTRSGNTITAQVTLSNGGGITATNVRLQEAILGTAGTLTTPLPTVASIAPGASATVTLTFPATAGSTGQSLFLKVKGIFNTGSFNANKRITLP